MQSPSQGSQGGTDLRFLSPLPDTSLHCKTTVLVQFSLVLTVLTHGGMARLRWPGWLGYIPRCHTCKRSPISVLTRLCVEQLCRCDQQESARPNHRYHKPCGKSTSRVTVTYIWYQTQQWMINVAHSLRVNQSSNQSEYICTIPNAMNESRGT